MKHLLQVGQEFRCAEFASFGHASIFTQDNKAPERDETRIGASNGPEAVFHWTEHGEAGWQRARETKLDLRVIDRETIALVVWRVVETQLTGGGSGHGPADRYPDGHFVRAIEQNVLGRPPREVTFYQTGCFIKMQRPEAITLVGGPPDEPGFYRSPQEP